MVSTLGGRSNVRILDRQGVGERLQQPGLARGGAHQHGPVRLGHEDVFAVADGMLDVFVGIGGVPRLGPAVERLLAWHPSPQLRPGTQELAHVADVLLRPTVLVKLVPCDCSVGVRTEQLVRAAGADGRGIRRIVFRESLTQVGDGFSIRSERHTPDLRLRVPGALQSVEIRSIHRAVDVPLVKKRSIVPSPTAIRS